MKPWRLVILVVLAQFASAEECLLPTLYGEIDVWRAGDLKQPLRELRTHHYTFRVAHVSGKHGFRRVVIVGQLSHQTNKKDLKALADFAKRFEHMGYENAAPIVASSEAVQYLWKKVRPRLARTGTAKGRPLRGKIWKVKDGALDLEKGVSLPASMERKWLAIVQGLRQREDHADYSRELASRWHEFVADVRPLRDQHMAKRIREYLAENPNGSMLVVCGANHVEGLYRHLERIY